MADSTTWLVAGIGIGVGIGIGAALLWRQQRLGGASPNLTVHDVHRDDDGRIQSVETVQGIGGGGVTQPVEAADAR